MSVYIPMTGVSRVPLYEFEQLAPHARSGLFAQRCPSRKDHVARVHNQDTNPATCRVNQGSKITLCDGCSTQYREIKDALQGKTSSDGVLYYPEDHGAYYEPSLGQRVCAWLENNPIQATALGICATVGIVGAVGGACTYFSDSLINFLHLSNMIKNGTNATTNATTTNATFDANATITQTTPIYTTLSNTTANSTTQAAPSENATSQNATLTPSATHIKPNATSARPVTANATDTHNTTSNSTATTTTQIVLNKNLTSTAANFQAPNRTVTTITTPVSSKNATKQLSIVVTTSKTNESATTQTIPANNASLNTTILPVATTNITTL